MDFNFKDVDAERQKTEKFAEDNNISAEELNNVYNKIYEELPDNLSDKAKELRALRKTRGSLRKIANTMQNYVEAIIIMRFRDTNFNEYAWNLVDDYVKENGIDKAKENGMVNEEGQYIYTSFTTQFPKQMGKVIDKKDARGSAVMLIANDDGDIEARFLSIGKFTVWKPIPLCREILVNVKEAESAGKLFTDKKQYFLNGVRTTTEVKYYSHEQFQQYADMIESTCGDIIFTDIVGMDDYAQSQTNNPNNFVAAFSTVNRIGNSLDDGSVPVEFELDDGLITAWSDKNIFKDLIFEEGISGLAMLNTWVNKEGEVKYNIGGFLPLDDDE